VVDPPAYRSLAADAAARVLRRYGDPEPADRPGEVTTE
jgi:hypothetical protein